MSQVNIEDFINKHLVKVFYTLIVFFMYNMYIDFKEVKVTLQQLLLNQATIELRISNMENNDRRQDVRLDAADTRREEFYKTYKLTKKKDGE